MSESCDRRDFLRGAAAAAFAATLGPAAAAEPFPVRLGFIGVATRIASIYQLIGVKNGVYRKYGIDLKLVGIGHGGPELVAAAASGQVDIGEVGTPILSAIANGAPLKVIGAPPYKRQPFVLVVRPDVKSFADLKQQTVSVGSVGGGGDQALDFMLKAHGLGPGDVRKILVSAGNGDFAALKSGRVAGAIMAEPFVSEAVAEGSGKVLARAVDYYGHYEHSYVFATDRFIAEHPQTITAFFAANREAIDYAKTHHAEFISFGVTQLGLSEAVITTYLNNYVSLWDDSQQVDIQGMLNAFEDMKQLGYIDRGYKPDVAKILDLRFVGQKA